MNSIISYDQKMNVLKLFISFFIALKMFSRKNNFLQLRSKVEKFC